MIQSFLDTAHTDPVLFIATMALLNAAFLTLWVTIKNIQESLNDLKSHK